MMLAGAMSFSSCSQVDNVVITDEDLSTYIELDGTQYYANFIASFKGEVGDEVTLTLGVYDDYDIYGVDFGDGNIVTDSVGHENKGVNLEGTTHTSATKFSGTVAGDGIIRVFGKSDLWYVLVTGGAAPVSLEQKKLARVVQMSITGANVESIVLPELTCLKQFSFNNSPLKSIDVSKATALTSLTINNTTASKYAPQLESIDLSNNTELTYLSLQANQNNYGKLKTIDLTNNTKLEGMGLYLQYNELVDVRLGENALTTINVQNNKLASIDTEKLPKLKNLYAADNQLKSIDVSNMANLAWLDVKNNQLEGDLDLTPNQKLTNVYVNNNQLTSVKVTDVTKQFYFDNNLLTFATIPALPASMNTASKMKQYHYAPQAALLVPEVVDVLDLSSQLTATGILEAPATTTFAFVTASGTQLAEGTDYEVTEPGKFKFLTEQTEKVHAVMTNEALPLFADADAFVTTEFSVTTQMDVPVAELQVWKAAADAVAAGTVLEDNNIVKISAAFAAPAAAAAEKICGIDFNAYIGVRSNTAVNADNFPGEAHDKGTPLVIDAKKDATIIVYYRRQTGDGFVAQDGKDIKLIDQADPAEKSAIAGTIQFDETLTDTSADYGFVAKTYEIAAGHTYALYGRGTTINLYGIQYIGK